MLILGKKPSAVKDSAGGGETVIICVTGHLFRLRDPEAHNSMYTAGGVFPPPVIPSMFRSEKIKKISTRIEVNSWLKSHVQDSVIISAGAGRVQTAVLNAAAVRNAETAGFVPAPFAGRETPPQFSNGTEAPARGKGQSYGLQVF